MLALSSGEAELFADFKTSTEVIGLLQMAKDWGLDLSGDIYVDSTAALGVVSRRGCGRMRHVRVGSLWIQEKKECGELHLKSPRV